MVERDRPPEHIIAKGQMKSVGITIEKSKDGIKFVFSDKQVVDELRQLGFSLEMLQVHGGEMPLPILATHVDEQAALEAYWGAQAEKARYEFMIEQDSFNYWYEAKYSTCFHELQDRGVSKPIQKEVEARISKKYPKGLKIRKDALRKKEYRYRLLCNACYASIVTKGKMMQTLRNIIQGNTYKMPLMDVDIPDSGKPDVTSLTPH